jgi:hypothetical protein
MNFKDYIKEQDDENEDDETSIPPEESEIGADEKDDMVDADESLDDDDMDEEEDDGVSESEADDETTQKVSELLPKILSGTFKTLQEVVIPVEDFLENSDITQEDLEFWIENSSDVYPDLTHDIEIDGENIIIRELGVEEDDEGEDEENDDETEEEEDDFEIEDDGGEDEENDEEEEGE